MVKLVKWGLYALILTPLLYQASSLYPFLTLKVVVFQSLVELLFAGYLYLAIFEPRFRPSPTPLLITFTAFIFVAFLTGWLGVDWRTSLWSFPERAIGTFGLLHFWAFFVMLVGLRDCPTIPFLLQSRNFGCGFAKKIREIASNIAHFFRFASLEISGFRNESGLSDSLSGREIHWRHFILCSFSVSLVTAMLAVFSGELRPGGVFGNPNFLSAYLLMNFFLGLYLLKMGLLEKHKWEILFLSLGLFLQFITIFITQTRGVILGFGCGLIFVFLSWLWRLSDNPISAAIQKFRLRLCKKNSRDYFQYRSFFSLRLARNFWISQRKQIVGQSLWQKNKIWVVTAIIGLGLALGGFWFSREAVFWKVIPGISRFTDFELQSALPRLNAWEAGWQGFKERPLLGWGWDNFEKVVNKYYEPVKWRSRSGEVFFSKPHNIIIEYAISGGLLLLLAFLSLIVTCFYETKDIFLRGLILAYLVPNLFSLDSFGVYLTLVIVLALIDINFKKHV